MKKRMFLSLAKVSDAFTRTDTGYPIADLNCLPLFESAFALLCYADTFSRDSEGMRRSMSRMREMRFQNKPILGDTATEVRFQLENLVAEIFFCAEKGMPDNGDERASLLNATIKTISNDTEDVPDVLFAIIKNYHRFGADTVTIAVAKLREIAEHVAAPNSQMELAGTVH